MGKAREVSGEFDGPADVLLGTVGDPLGEAELGELAQPPAGDGKISHQREHGHAHPESVEAGGVAVVGEGIDHQVDAVVLLEVGQHGAGRDELHAVGGRTLEPQKRPDAVAMPARWRKQDKARSRECGEESRPKAEDRVGDLPEAIETAEGDVASGQCGQGIDRKPATDGSVVAPEAVRKVDDLLRAGRRRDAGGIEEAIAEPVVDGVKAGATGVASKADLHRSGPPREDEQSMPRGVLGEVDEEIDAVGANLVGEGFIAQRAGLTPVVGCGGEALGKRVAPGDVGVAKDLELGPIVPGNDGQDLIAHGVTSEIRGNVADPQAAI